MSQNANTSGKAQVMLSFPKIQQQPQPVINENIVIVNEQKRKCMDNCCPVLSTGCDLCSTCCGDFYRGGLCNSIGFTGLLTRNSCLVYDEQYGGCGECIGCKRDCPQIGPCPYYAGGWYGGYNAGNNFGGPYYGNWPQQ